MKICYSYGLNNCVKCSQGQFASCQCIDAFIYLSNVDEDTAREYIRHLIKNAEPAQSFSSTGQFTQPGNSSPYYVYGQGGGGAGGSVSGAIAGTAYPLTVGTLGTIATSAGSSIGWLDSNYSAFRDPISILNCFKAVIETHFTQYETFIAAHEILK